ncbi:MAG: endo-1,4-beta-xylanase [Gemmataceae bacterium]|nr:endo-1,4-beta-xylanase [Gemmataceae bacterium]
MGTMLFQLPPNLPEDARAELERASVAGGQDCMPYPTQALLDDQQLILNRRVEESGCLQAPWNITGAGHLMTCSATLMERMTPYHLLIELARGKINQLRGQTADWLMGGLLLGDSLAEQIRRATHMFGKAVARTPSVEAAQDAEQALAHGFEAASNLVDSYIQQVYQVRHQRQPRLDTWSACTVPREPDGDTAAAFLRAFNAAQLAFSWQQIEPVEGQPQWDQADALVHWASQNQLHLIGGPLIDFTGRDIPDWLWEKERDLLSLSNYMTEFAAEIVRRYHSQIRTWQISAANNWAGVLAMGDEELLWLTVRMIDAVKKIDPTLEVIVGIAQPWGDYLAQQERSQSPFVFADTLLRTGVKLAGLELEMLMGVTPRGCYCRDTLDASRILDLYALLGVPLQVLLGYPSAADPDPQADPDQGLGAGHWRSGFSPVVQADWITAFANLAVCKPFVRTVRWTQFSDAAPHAFPHCGLVDAAGQIKPGLEALERIRQEHLK